MKLAGEARHRLEKKQKDLSGGARNGSARSEKHTQVIPGSVDRAHVSTLGIHSARPPIRGGKDREEKKEERRKEERKRGCALINMSYKNAGVHNLHEPKTESKNRYVLSFSSLFLCLVHFLTLSIFSAFSLSLSPGSPFTG